jgi:exopolyphosphatase/guanosine-5'-triphosphate,3'-diphosphate pyrophosphatase
MVHGLFNKLLLLINQSILSTKRDPTIKRNNLVKKAVIDIGTNTFHLLIAEISNQKPIHIIYKKTIAVKLGEGGVNKGFIAEAAYQRGIDALLTFRKELNIHQIENIKATATAAVRDASNGLNFINDALAKAEIKIEIIDGLQEAEYIYVGAKSAGVLSANTSLIMDIGGGSVEFIICNQQLIFWKKSYRLGAARLLADFYHEDPISKNTISKIHQLLASILTDLFEAVTMHQPTELIGTAGSFDSFAELNAIKNNSNFEANSQLQYLFNEIEFHNLLVEIIASSHQQRKDMKGLITLRVDMILMASILTQFIIKQTKIKRVITCTYYLKEGLLMSDF